MAGSRRLALCEGEYVIGRDPASARWLDVAGVSRHQARMVVVGEGAQIEDLASKNGTRVGDVPLTACRCYGIATGSVNRRS
jgi:pSer/pThr/pTyr-binding forkhead associated (FHA) protein